MERVATSLEEEEMHYLLSGREEAIQESPEYGRRYKERTTASPLIQRLNVFFSLSAFACLAVLFVLTAITEEEAGGWEGKEKLDLTARPTLAPVHPDTVTTYRPLSLRAAAQRAVHSSVYVDFGLAAPDRRSETEVYHRTKRQVVNSHVNLRHHTQPYGKPVIGVLSMPMNPMEEMAHRGSYFFSNYVPYLHSGMADVVPIFYDMPEEAILDILSKVNGVFFTGGSLVINTTDYSHHPYSRTAAFIYKKVKQLNEEGTFLPLWGTCQGFEVIAVQEAGPDVLKAVDAEGLLLSLNLTAEARSSKLFSKAPNSVLDTLTSQSATVHLHHWAVFPEDFNASPALKEHFRVLATNVDKEGTEFISIYEHRKLPIFAVQFHPEIFPWNINKTIPFSADIDATLKFFSRSFVGYAHESRQSYPSREEEEKAFVDNYPTVPTGWPGVSKYKFPPYTKNR